MTAGSRATTQRTKNGARYGHQILVALWIVLISYLEFRGWWKDHKAQIDMLMDASEGVLQGTPHWRAYQNRLLGPALVHMFGTISAIPLKTLAAVSILSSNLMLYVMSVSLLQAHEHSSPPKCWPATLTLLLPWGIWQLGSHFFSYPWDFVELHVLLALAYLALMPTEAKPWQLIGLFAVALTSRESALFIPMFMLCRAWMGHEPNRSRQTWLALSMLVAGMAIVQLTRHLLFKHSSLPDVGNDSTHAALGNHMTWDINLADWHTVLQTGEYLRPFALFSGLTVFYAGASWLLWRRRETTASSFALTMLIYMLALVPMAHLKEGRIYQPVGACTALLVYFIWLNPNRAVVSPKVQP